MHNTETSPIRHALPGEPGDSAWFYRQNKFEQGEILRQVAFKRRQWPDLADGHSRNRPQHYYPHILPEGNERLAFYPAFADEVQRYMEREHIAPHTELLNLKSSQAACLNFLFPLRQDRVFCTKVLRHFLSGLVSIEDIQFEYTGPAEATEWLGEPRSGGRGQNRTSIDTAIFWRDNQGNMCATLAEWKYTERNDGRCSAYGNGSKDDRTRCRSLNVTSDADPARSCLLNTGKRHRDRRYWEHMAEAGIDLRAFEGVDGCPFQGPFYQIMRQYQLAAFLRQSGRFDRAEVISIGFSGNKSLQRSPRQLWPLRANRDQPLTDIWNSVIVPERKLRHITVEQLMGVVDQYSAAGPGWRNYILDRYGV